MKITHVYPRLGSFVANALLGAPQQQVGDGDTVDDVWEHIRYTSRNEDPAGSVLVINNYFDKGGAYSFEAVHKELIKGVVCLSRVSTIHLPDVVKKVSVPAEPAHQLVVENLGTGTKNVTDVTAKPARIGTITTERRLHLGNLQNVRLVAKIIKEAASTASLVKFFGNETDDKGKLHRPPVRLVVIWNPNEEEGDLNCFPQFCEMCPDVDVVIFHRDSAKCGVVYEGDDSDSMWDTQTEVEQEADLPWVIENIAHECESTWIGAPPKQGKTWVMLCVAKALLTGEPLFNDTRLKVPVPSRRLIYLGPEVTRGPFKKRLTMLGLMKHLYDPITNPDGRFFLRTLSKGQKIALTNPELLKASKGADVFIDTAVRYLDGDENSVQDVKVLTENILNIIPIARSVWIAHHATTKTEAGTPSLGNMFRGSSEFSAALTNAYGLVQEEKASNTVRLVAIDGRDLDELLPDMILQGRPHLYNEGNFRVIDANAAPRKAGAKPTSEKQQKIEFARTVSGSLQEKADAVNEKFGSNHGKSTISEWLKDSQFKGEASND